MGQGGNGFAVSLKVGGLVLPSILRRGVMDLLSLLIYKIDYPPKVEGNGFAILPKEGVNGFAIPLKVGGNGFAIPPKEGGNGFALPSDI